MSLEAQAKTTRQVIDTGLGTENWDLKSYYKTNDPKVALDFEKPMWVSLEEAQKTAAELEKWQVDWQNLNDEKMRLDSKIIETNKILSEIATYPEYQGFIENSLIPCKAPCARQYEGVFRRIQELIALLSSKESSEVKQE